jgi:hypothetical protein
MVEMLKSRPWRRVIYRFGAVTILLSILSVGALVSAPSGSAAVQTGPSASTTATQKSETIVPGKNPHSPLCKKVHAINLTLRKQASNLKKLQSGNWSAFQKVFLAYDQVLSNTSQAVIDVGTNVPANVRTAARKEVLNVKVLQKLVRKARDTAGLNASMNGTGTSDLLSAQGPVIDYVAAQCGSTQRTLTGVSGTEVPVTTPTSTQRSMTGISGTDVPVTTATSR